MFKVSEAYHEKVAHNYKNTKWKLPNTCASIGISLHKIGDTYFNIVAGLAHGKLHV